MEDPHKPSFLEVREHLKTSEYDRSYLYWSADEDQYLLRLHQEKRLSNLEIAKILRRTLGSIKAIRKIHTGRYQPNYWRRFKCRFSVAAPKYHLRYYRLFEWQFSNGS